jgi:hypothetical protein
MKYLKGVLLVFFLGVCFTCINSAEKEVLYGVRQVKMSTSSGNIYLLLPEDIAPKDTISGKLISEPSGETKKKRSKNEKQLDNYSVEMSGEKTAVKEKWVKWEIPDGNHMEVKLLNPKGDMVDTIRVPVQYTPPPIKIDGFQCPAIAEAERPFHIKGDFNGNFSDTNVMMGDTELEKLAESPREVIVESPSDVIGNTMLNYSEGNVKGTCELCNISVHPHADQYKLHPGEITKYTVMVNGLGNLTDIIQLNITNKTPDVAILKGEGIIYIQPSDVTNGTFVYETTITGLKPGPFIISARLTDEGISPVPEKYGDIANRIPKWKQVAQQLLMDADNLKQGINLIKRIISDHLDDLKKEQQILKEEGRVIELQKQQLIKHLTNILKTGFDIHGIYNEMIVQKLSILQDKLALTQLQRLWENYLPAALPIEPPAPGKEEKGEIRDDEEKKEEEDKRQEGEQEEDKEKEKEKDKKDKEPAKPKDKDEQRAKHKEIASRYNELAALAKAMYEADTKMADWFEAKMHTAELEREARQFKKYWHSAIASSMTWYALYTTYEGLAYYHSQMAKTR